MIFNDVNNILNKNFHTIIIGSGPAGISVAKNLKKKISSLIVEAGSMESSSISQEEYEGKL